MIRRAPVIFCDNEHGMGEVSFPPIAELEVQAFIDPVSQRELRKQAKQAGWSRHNGADYCPSCTESL
ncbi:MAG TPA: hypothetical protein VKY85_07850 [Candidatus Angelobacter sp.]|nr:hypothetical protein [Candidatus Angelobacter sp.]